MMDIFIVCESRQSDVAFGLRNNHHVAHPRRLVNLHHDSSALHLVELVPHLLCERLWYSSQWLGDWWHIGIEFWVVIVGFDGTGAVYDAQLRVVLQQRMPTGMLYECRHTRN